MAMRIWATFWQRWVKLVTHTMQFLILFIFFSSTWYWRPRWIFSDNIPSWLWENVLAYYDPIRGIWVNYFAARYTLTLLIVLLVILWVLSGFNGLRRIALDGRLWWALSLLALIGVILLSTQRVNPPQFVPNTNGDWRPNPTYHAEVANTTSQAAQWVLVGLFAIIVASLQPVPRAVAVALVAGMIGQGGIGVAQSLVQHEVGIGWLDDNWFKIGLHLYEFRLDPEKSGVAVVQSGGIRFLRAYGLTAHPNLLGGALAMGLIAALFLWFNPVTHRVAGWVTALGLWALFLTFSRASLGGFAVGVAIVAVYWGWMGRWKGDGWRVAAAFGSLLLLVGGMFYLSHQSLVDVRAGTGEEGRASVEARSVESRRVYMEQARYLIEEHGLLGVGIGNFPWQSARLIQQDERDLDLSGDYVHNIYFLAVAEVGIVGTALTALTIAIVAWQVAARLWSRTLAPETACLWAGCCAWLATGWFEPFPWTLFTHQVVLWGVLAAVLIPTSGDDDL